MRSSTCYFSAMRYKNQPLSPEKKHQQNCPTKKPIIWVNYNDLTVLPHWKSWFRCGKSSPFMATPFRLVKYDNLPRYIGNSNPNWRTHIFQRGRAQPPTSIMDCPHIAPIMDCCDAMTSTLLVYATSFLSGPRGDPSAGWENQGFCWTNGWITLDFGPSCYFEYLITYIYIIIYRNIIYYILYIIYYRL